MRNKCTWCTFWTIFTSKFPTFGPIFEVNLYRKPVKFVGLFIFIIENWMTFFIFVKKRIFGRKWRGKMAPTKPIDCNSGPIYRKSRKRHYYLPYFHFNELSYLQILFILLEKYTSIGNFAGYGNKMRPLLVSFFGIFPLYQRKSGQADFLAGNIWLWKISPLNITL